MRPSLQAKNLIIARSSQTSRFSSRQPSQGLGGGNTGTIAVIKTGPKAMTPESLYPDLPIGGSYGDLLAYFVGKNVPTFRFVDMPASMACVALGFAYIAVFFPIPVAYLYLDNSLTSQTWYYVYRYLADSQYAIPPSVGPVSGSSGPLTMISEDPSLMPADGGIPFFLPPPTPQNNTNLVQVTLGQAPTIPLSN